MRRLLCHGCLAAAIVAASPLALAAQQAATITGRVLAEGDRPLAAASVFIPTMNLGTTTSATGTYTFTVPASRVTGQTVGLTARLVGFRAQTVQVVLRPGTITQDFTLVSAPATLSAVVVTGAGTVSTRERLGNVINSVDSSVLQRATQPQNVVSALSGTAPNVIVRTSSGEPGASASIQIRGATSVTGTNQPLFVVDGQPIDNTTISTAQGPADFAGSGSTVSQNRAADINPNDIESVEILKGAAASAIYGARAANGVVLITTKRGRPGATRYSLQSTSTFDRVSQTIPLQRRFGQGTGGNAGQCADPDCFAQLLTWGPALSGAQTFDHSDEIFKTGSTLDNNLSISGGTERTSFFLSGGLTAQDGVIIGPNNRYNRTSVRLKATHAMSSRINVGGNLSYIDSRGRFVQKGSNTSGLLLGALRTPPDFDNEPYIDPTSGLHRSYRFPNPSTASASGSRGYDNPLFTASNPGNQSELGRFVGNVSVEWSPLSWLRIQEQLGSDYYADQRLEALPLTSSANPVGQVTRLDLSHLMIDNNLLLTANREFSPNLTARLSLGQNLNSRRYRQIWAQGQNLIAAQPFVTQNTVNPAVPQEYRTLVHIEGYFGQAEVDLWNQVFMTVGLRNDGFSTFGSGERRANYPKASLAWTFTNALGNGEQRGLLSLGKLRAAYGETGREPPVYGTITAYSTTSVFGSGYGDFISSIQGGQGGVVTALSGGNPDLKPERNREVELGVDFGFFDQRADLGFTWFDKRSEDVILFVPSNASETGFQRRLANGASIRNRGVELTFNARPYTSARTSWEVGVNYGRLRGKVNSLLGAEFIPYNNEGFTGSIGTSSVGFAPGVIRGSDFARCGRGLVINDVDIDAACGAGAKQDALYLADNGQPIYDPTDRVIADPNPRWNMGINSSLRVFGGLRFSGLLDIRRGGQVWNGTRGALYRFGTHQDTEIRGGTAAFGQNFYTQEYPDVAGPGVGKPVASTPAEWQTWFTTKGGNASLAQAQFVEDGSFVKLRELSVAYTFGQQWLRSRLGFASIDLRLAGRNLATWTDYRGLDPESNLGGAEFLTQGVDYFNNPQTRSFVLSATVNR
ncbi:MAG: SusC/RagA family TonB-linked outer membrane protein [Gemmatirosa sp.]